MRYNGGRDWLSPTLVSEVYLWMLALPPIR
jgi:hypothetical protein